MTALSRARSGLDLAERGARLLATVSTVLLLAVTSIDVALRAGTGRGVPGAIEITEVVLVVAVFLGMMTASRDGMHITATLVTDRLPHRAARTVRVIGGTLGLVAVGWLIVGTLTRAMTSVASGEFRFGLISVPVWPARVAIVVGLVGLAVALLAQLVALIRPQPEAHAGDARTPGEVTP